MNASATISRGEVWWADLPDPTGAGPGYRRPVLVVQADAFNRSAIATVIIVVLTSDLRLGSAPGNVVIARGTAGLPKTSVVNVTQIATVDKAALFEEIGQVDDALLATIATGLRRSFTL